MTLTVPGGRIASNRSTPNIPRLETVKVPTKTENSYSTESDIESKATCLNVNKTSIKDHISA